MRNNILKMESIIQIRAAHKTTAIITTIVLAISYCLVGQVTFFNSTLVSLRKVVMLNPLFSVSVVSGTAILSHPCYYYPVTHEPILFGLFVQSVFFAELAIFIELDTIRIVLFVFVGLVISLFALSASQSNQVTHLVTPRLRT